MALVEIEVRQREVRPEACALRRWHRARRPATVRLAHRGEKTRTAGRNSKSHRQILSYFFSLSKKEFPKGRLQLYLTVRSLESRVQDDGAYQSLPHTQISVPVRRLAPLPFNVTLVICAEVLPQTPLTSLIVGAVMRPSHRCLAISSARIVRSSALYER